MAQYLTFGPNSPPYPTPHICCWIARTHDPNPGLLHQSASHYPNPSPHNSVFNLYPKSPPPHVPLDCMNPGPEPQITSPQLTPHNPNSTPPACCLWKLSPHGSLLGFCPKPPPQASHSQLDGHTTSTIITTPHHNHFPSSPACFTQHIWNWVMTAQFHIFSSPQKILKYIYTFFSYYLLLFDSYFWISIFVVSIFNDNIKVFGLGLEIFECGKHVTWLNTNPPATLFKYQLLYGLRRRRDLTV